MTPYIMDIFNRYYPENHPARKILLKHSYLVAKKALEVALNFSEEKLDLNFIAEAAFLHDIGILKTHAPSISCYGEKPYICHGVSGREILESEGLPKHALVCERHTGAGLKKEDIEKNKLPLPLRDMLPLSLEEKIICYADKFFSKNPENYQKEKSLYTVRKELKNFGEEQLSRFDKWHKRFSSEDNFTSSLSPLPGWKEFDLIEKLISPNKSPDIIIGPGDDAACLTSLKNPVISTDTQREGVHFLKEWKMPYEALGYKAVMAAASDLAACFARPVALFLNLGLPLDEREEDIIRLKNGMEEALLETGGLIAGGNICRAEALSMDLFFIGEGESSFPERSKLKEGEKLYITGPLGEAAAGCHALLNGRDKDFPKLVRRFFYPKARFDCVKHLSEAGVSCLMDISDGLAGDILHIAKASKKTIDMDISSISITKELSSYCRKFDKNPLSFALSGGEDYELLFSATEKMAENLYKKIPAMQCIASCSASSKGLIRGLPPWALTAFSHEKI